MRSDIGGAELARALARHSWPADVIARGLYLYLPEEARDYVYWVSAGRLRISRVDASGQERAIALLGPGDLFGELPEGPREYVLQAVEDLTVKTVDRTALEEQGTLPVRATLRSEGEQVEVVLPLAHLLYTAPRPRLARVLRQLVEEYGVPGLDKRVIVPLKLTARALISLTGLSEEAVREALHALLAERVIELEGGELHVRRRAELERLAESRV